MTLEERERLAAELVMGLLEGEERREAERLEAGDEGFRAAVAAWQARFSELDETASPQAIGDALWRRIEGGLAAPAAAPVPVTQAAPVLVPDPRNAFKALWSNLAFWRVAGLSGAFATMALALGLTLVGDQRTSSPVFVAVLLNDANQPTGIINAYGDGRAELVPFAGLQIPAGRSFQVWAIPAQNQSPISVGVVTEARSHRLDLQRVPLLRPDQTFAISLEPPNGSPTGLPTGPVLMKGTTTTPL